MVEITIGQAQTAFWSPQIIAAIISGIIALVTGMIVAVIAWRQWQTAKDKLAIDLFDKRFKAWKELETAFGSYVVSAEKRYMGRGQIMLDQGVLADWVKVESDSVWLFGNTIFGEIRKVGDLLAQLQHCDLDEDDEGEPFERKQRFEERLAHPSYIAFAAVRKQIEPYMMLDKIAVNLPSEPWRLPWASDAPKS